MMSPLYATLHRWAATPHEWGQSDCMMALADWVHLVRGFDPGAGIRGTYGDPDICPVGRALRRDPEPHWRKALHDLPITDAPLPGDVALVAVPGTRFLCGALRLKGNWAMKTSGKGVCVTRRATMHLCWAVGYEA